MAFELNIPITFSSDAHAVEQVGFGYGEAVAMAKGVGYTKTVSFKQKERRLVTF
jgi:histidinol-phosphatase (PHP family)